MTTLESGQTALINKPTWRFMIQHPAHLIAQGFGSGLSPIMPGTTGTLFGWFAFIFLSNTFPVFMTAQHWGVLILVSFTIGVWTCSITGRHMGVADHGSMVWDEIVAFWLVLVLLMPADFKTQCWAFVWFRFFDMVKPPPIAYFDRKLKGGFGVMWDDIVAAFFTLLVFALWKIL